MKIQIDAKKGIKAVSGALQKTTEVGKKVTENVKKGAIEISEKGKMNAHLRKMKKYNPLFWEQFNSSEFNLPNMIIIVDDAVRRDIDVCKGAIGWLNNEKGMEVLYLYDEAVIESGIQFVPAAICDTIYYVDRFDRNRFVQVECIFSKAHEEKIAELENIAYKLGAKSCSIEIVESDRKQEVKKKETQLEEKMTYDGAKVSLKEHLENNYSHKESRERKGCIEIQFEGSDIVERPELKWFLHDDGIKNLIEMRMNNVNSVKSKVLKLEGSMSATMSCKTAIAIDNVIGQTGTKAGATMESHAVKENSNKLYFSIEF